VEGGTLGTLQAWYAARCDGNWEQEFGVTISTSETSGWELRVDLVDTPLNGTQLTREREARSPDDWIEVWCDGYTFNAVGGVVNLEELLALFVSFAERVEARA
jgi:Immunity protein 53